jgi:hypothetical protein
LRQKREFKKTTKKKMRLFAHRGTIYEETKDQKWRRYTGPNCVWYYIRGKGEPIDASDVPLGLAKQATSFVECTLLPSAVRLWLTIPRDRVRVYLWNDSPVHVKPLHDTQKVGPQALKAARMGHFHALVGSLLYGREQERGFSVGAFVASVCERMAVSIEVGEARRLAKRPLMFEIYTLEGRVRLRDVIYTSPDREVVDVFLDAHAATLKANRPEGWKERTADARKTEFELRAYAAIAEQISVGPEASEKYGLYLHKLITRVTAPMQAPPRPPASQVALKPTLTIDSLCIMHALYATGDGGKVKLAYVNDGTENFVFSIMQPRKHGYETKEKAEFVLRVRKSPTGERNQDADVKSERRIVHSLRGQGVVPPIDAETKVIVLAQDSRSEHGATVMRMFNSGSLDRPIENAGAAVSFNGVGDALVELYARLSTVARCVDTREANVVLNVERGVGIARRTIALIDTDGHRCSFLREKAGEAEKAGGARVLRYIGPLDLVDLSSMLAAAAMSIQKLSKGSEAPKEDKKDMDTLLDDPLLFAAVCLLVLLVANEMDRKRTYPTMWKIIIKHLSVIWHLVTRYDETKGLSPTQTAQSTLAHYSLRRDLRGDALKGHVHKVLTQRYENTQGAPQDLAKVGVHYRAYWCGPDRLIADDDEELVREIRSEFPEPASTGAEIASLIRAAAESEYGKGKLSETRLATHVALAEHRFYHEVTQEQRDRALLPNSPPVMSERRAAMVRFRVDRITATALVEVMERERHRARARALAGPGTGPSAGPSIGPSTGPGPSGAPEEEPEKGSAAALYTEDPAGGAEACARAMASVLIA